MRILYTKESKYIAGAFILLIFISLATHYYGSTDIGDYGDIAKFFAGKFKADVRNSHSYLYGFVHSPLVRIVDSFILLKVSSLVFLFLIIYSVYLASEKDKRALWLITLSPIIWYMGPWVNPIQIASLFFLWSYVFIKKYNLNNKIAYLLYSGVFLGLGWAFWNTILYFGAFLAIAFMYNKKVSHLIYLVFFIFIGLIPNLVLDHFLFNFAFFTIFKTTLSNISATFLGGIYGSSDNGIRYARIVLVLLTVPIYFWKLYSIKKFAENKKTIIFLTLCLLLILATPQIRYMLAIVPIMTLVLCKNLDDRQFKTSIIFSIIVSLVFVFPYIIQISNGFDKSLDGKDIAGVIENPDSFKLSKEFYSDIVIEDLELIERDFPDEKFIVGELPDDYQRLASLYWGDKINKFISIQDYNAFAEGETGLFKKRLEPSSNIPDRRIIWIEGGIDVNLRNLENIDNVEYGISIGEDIGQKEFELVREYNILKVWEKVQ